MFAKTDVNTGRQVEFDYMKGLFIPLILLILRAFANVASVLLLAGVLYAIHPFYYSCILALAAYVPFSVAFCLAMSVAVWALCFVTILLWNRICKKQKHL